MESLMWAKEFFETYQPQYAKFNDYYDGKHAILMSEETRSTIFGRLLKGMRDNLMPVVIDTMVDRLSLLGFASADVEAKKLINQMWQGQRMTSKAITIHHQCQLNGDAYVLVWPAVSGKPTLYPQAYGTIAVKYDYSQEEPIIVEAVKAWTETIYDTPNNPYGKKVRLFVTIYKPDVIEKYYQDYGMDSFTWGMFPTSTAELKYVDVDAVLQNPYGKVPMFRFFASKDPTKFAMSAIRDAIPLQDGVNKALKDLMMSSEFQGFAQRWLTGVDIPTNPETGQPIEPFKNTMDRIWAISSETARFGQFEAGNLMQLIAELNDFRYEIARVTRTPAHLFLLNTGDFPSGEALRTAEAPLLGKIADAQAFLGDVWEDIMRFAYQIQTDTVADELDISAIWGNTMQYTEKEFVDTLVQKLELGLSQDQALKELGYSDEQIETMLAANEAKVAKEDARAIRLAQATKS